ncbi:heterokaryon incompatibility protein-domain-containing protein [Lasiosphaeria hispida]|uniref:Heterokaryon incompatibility protein-domain-containing protein n=1 Tax=Lasiosphaeria hispida TaxID=260671 RepID=A0AAJ0H7P0_9PEZI|nr:heterokaryon incompatibility protein-domain-containing protein [Lasiosphaeria hispida]
MLMDPVTCSHPALSYEPIPASDARILRVLKLAAGDPSSPLVGTLSLAAGVVPINVDTSNLEDGGQGLVEYEALSYCWGDPTKTASMMLNGTPFGISANLEGALTRLRKPDAESVVWVDAICINQNDDAEKRREVTRMRAIYYGAKHVAVWLGPEEPDSNVAIDLADEIYGHFQRYCSYLGVKDEGEGIFDWISSTERLQIVEDFLTADRIDAWKALHRLLSRPWFGRAWTLQELIVARASLVLCGERSVAWQVLELAINVCDVTYGAVHTIINPPNDSPLDPLTAYIWPPYHLEFLNSMAITRAEYRFLDERNVADMIGRPGTFARAESASSRLTQNTNRGCSLPHDKIYSVLGILPPALRNAITPDYSIPARTAFARAVKACVETTGWLNIICHSHYAPWYPANHPSWLPDWTRLPRATIFAERNRDALLPPHDVVRDTLAQVSFSEDLSVLTAAGFVVGEVLTPGFEHVMFPKLERTSRFLTVAPAEIRRWRDALYPTDPEFQYIPNAEEDIAWLDSDPNYWESEAEFRILVGPAILSHGHPGFGDVLDRFLGRLQYLIEEEKKGDGAKFDFKPVEKEREGEYQGFYNKVRGHLMSRTLFLRAGEGELGIGPDFTKPGDLICILFGCDAPVLLRKNDGKYMFVGEAHVPGFMEGQGMDGLREGKYALADFDII